MTDINLQTIKTNADVGRAVATAISGAADARPAVKLCADIARARWGSEVPKSKDAREAGDAYCDERGFAGDTRKSRKSEVVSIFMSHTVLSEAADKVAEHKDWNGKLGYPEIVKLARKLKAAKLNVNQAVKAYYTVTPAKTKSLADKLQDIADSLGKLNTRKNTKNATAVDKCLEALKEAGYEV